MRRFTSLVSGAAVVLGISVWVAPVGAGADAHHPGPPGAAGIDHVVFVQNDDTAGNQVVAYDRSSDGSLVPSSTYDTGGLGGQLNGSAVDHLASQGSLAYDPLDAVLYAVNAGSNSVSVFSVRGDRLALQQVVSSGGTFPVSVTVHDRLVYVLNALNGGSVTGYREAGAALHPIPGSTRSLDLQIPSDSSQFTHTPGQVAFSPDGSQLIVTTKASGNDIDVFGVAPDGRLSGSPVVNDEPGTVPFAVSFDPAGHLVVADAGTNALATYALDRNGTLGLVDAVGTGQAATCWATSARGFWYASNAGSASVSGYQDASDGQLTLLGTTATDSGTVDSSSSADGQFLYVQTGGNGIVDEFAVGSSGTLSEIGSVTVPDAVGGEGIVAS